MTYNFKSIADVEVVAEPLNHAKILIEEDGVIKKTAMLAADDVFDVVFFINQNFDDITLQSGDLKTVVQKMRDCKPIKSCLLCKWSGGSPSMYEMCQNGNIMTPFYVFEDNEDNDDYLSFIFVNHGGCYWVDWYPDRIHAYHSSI